MNNGNRTTQNEQLPPVDFSDINDVAGSASLLVSVARKNGERNIAAAREWLGNVETVLPSLSPGDALRVADSYEAVRNLLHPTSSLSKNTTSDITTSCRINAFEALVSGDKSVNRYLLRNAISREIDRRNLKFFGKPLQWESVCIDRWYRQFKYGVSIDNLSDYDTINRVTSLLTSDLWAFETRNESRFKQTLFENHRHYLDSIHDSQFTMHNESRTDCPDHALCIMNYELINALPSFLLASSPYLTPGEYTAYDTQIRTALYNHPATNRFQKASIAITLSN
ncbi:MAG: hypothetical protein K2G52_00090 [Muribaculaceae bacterium]|nr:hypothetical protein [Muribaculaceae bacterium]